MCDNPTPASNVSDGAAITNKETRGRLGKLDIHDLVQPATLVLVSAHTVLDPLGCITYRGSEHGLSASNRLAKTSRCIHTVKVVGLTVAAKDEINLVSRLTADGEDQGRMGSVYTPASVLDHPSARRAATVGQHMRHDIYD